jgi:hypothetical protein
MNNDMNNALKNRFPPFRDEGSLKRAIESVCVEFGKVTSLRILPANRAAGLQCICIFQLDSAAAVAALRSNYEVIDFGTELLAFVEVHDEWSGAIA